MKTLILLTFALLLLVSPSIAQFKFMRDAFGGTKDMVRAYKDMREANYKGADKYFHARGNFDAAQRGPGGVWSSKVISNTREFIQGANKQDSIDDQKANNWGRNGGDPNKYRPKGLPGKY